MQTVKDLGLKEKKSGSYSFPTNTFCASDRTQVYLLLLVTHRYDADHAVPGEAVLPAIGHHCAVPHPRQVPPQQTRAQLPRSPLAQVIEVNLRLQQLSLIPIFEE